MVRPSGPILELSSPILWPPCHRNVEDLLGNAIALKGTSLDGKFDLVVLQKGEHSFLSFVRHARWESVSNQPAKGKLMYLRVKFEEGRRDALSGTNWDSPRRIYTASYGSTPPG